MAETVQLRVTGNSTEVANHIVETDIDTSGAGGIIGQRRNIWTPQSGAGDSDITLYPATTYYDIGYKRMYISDPSLAQTTFLVSIRSAGTYVKIPYNTTFITLETFPAQTIDTLTFKYEVNFSATYLGVTSNKARLRFRLYEDDGVPTLISQKTATITSTGWVTGSLSDISIGFNSSGGNKLRLTIEAGFFPDSPT